MEKPFKRLLCVVVFSICGDALAQEEATTEPAFDPTAIVRVEEDWIAYIRNPDQTVGAPQIVNVISANQSTDGVFGMVELNHQSKPQFRSGGFQVQTWIGETNHAMVFSEEVGALRNSYDKMTYTVGLSLSSDEFQVSISNGRSRTWGKFARTPLVATAPRGSLTMADYSPQFSVDNTTVNVGAHRVELIYQQRVRYYSADGLVHTDETPRVIHRYQEVVQYVSLEDYEQNLSEFNIDITSQ